MSHNCADYDEIKRKIRKLKKLEIKIRFHNVSYTDCKQGFFERPKNLELVWDKFLDLHEVNKNKAKYSIGSLAKMNKEEYKNVISEFFFNVYYIFYKENGIISVHLYEPDLLIQIGLPIDADGDSIKKKFRELAKKFHPDIGGDSTKFIELMENYKKLIDYR